MTEQQPANSGGKQGGRFQPGQSGNPLGRPAGSRNTATLLLADLIDGEGEDIVRALVTAAKAGDVSAGRTLLDRLVPPRKDRPVAFALPTLHTAADAVQAMAALTAAVASGALTPSEATELARLVEAFTKALEAADFETRLAALEQHMGTARCTG
jgi:hypothetical protein